MYSDLGSDAGEYKLTAGNFKTDIEEANDERYLRIDADAPDKLALQTKTTFAETITVNGVIQVNDQTNGFNGVGGTDQTPCIQRVFKNSFSGCIRFRAPGRNDIDTAAKVNIVDPISPKPDGTAQAFSKC